jgi:hypothetical protein
MRITLKYILGKQDLKVRIGFIWFIIGITAGSCEHDNEPSGSVKGGLLLD